MRTISHNLHAPDELEDEFPLNHAVHTASFIQTRTAAESIAHDLNNVLSLITMAAELLGAHEIGKEEQRFLQIIEDGTARGQGISRRLFDLVKGMGAQ
jgi:signal transduction histidine kinase